MDKSLKPFTDSVQADAWTFLKAFTAARIALGRTGTAVPLREALLFKLDHAHARDAVWSTLDTDDLAPKLASMGLSVYNLKTQAADRQQYLQRPDLGRRLDAHSLQKIKEVQAAPASIVKEDHATPADISIVLADGLSASAINVHAVPFLQLLVPSLLESGFRMTRVCLVQNGRVAIGDEIGALLHAKLSVVLIGERPGLTAPDSMGIYLTNTPRPGLTDRSRNCISNIRPEGLSYPLAAEKLMYLIRESLRLGISGIELKDNTTGPGMLSR